MHYPNDPAADRIATALTRHIVDEAGRMRARNPQGALAIEEGALAFLRGYAEAYGKVPYDCPKNCRDIEAGAACIFRRSIHPDCQFAGATFRPPAIG